MKNDLISVIIPVYNVEKYINRCIESVVSQTYQNIEIILINDGSTDDSGKICNEWENKDKRINVVHRNNGGVSSARNVGINKMNGEYVIFIDADDILEGDMIEILHKNMIMNNVDMSVCSYCMDKQAQINNKIIDANNFYSCLFEDGIKGYLWNKLLKSKIIKKNNIKFDEQICICEDSLFVVNYLKYCNYIFYTNQQLYHYVIRKDSTMSSITNYENRLKQLVALEKIIDELKKDKIKNIYLKYEIEYLFISVDLIYGLEKKDKINKKSIKEKIKEYKRDRFYKLERNLFRKIKILFCLYLPHIYIKLKKNIYKETCENKKTESLAIVTPGFLPVPAIYGGAVEVLIEELINGNEKAKRFNIDLYTVPNDEYRKYNFEQCNIIQVKVRKKHRIYCKVYSIIIRGFLRKKQNQISPFGIATNELMKKKVYNYILIENNMRVFNSIKNKKNVIFHLHNDLNEDRPPYLCKKVINNSNCILNVSNYLADKMNKIEKSEKNRILYNCVDFDIFNSEKIDGKEKERLKHKYNIKENDFVFFFSGRICDEKGVYELIEAFKRVLDKIKNVKLLIVGKGWFGENELSNYERKIYEVAKDIKSSIIFSGFIEYCQMPNILDLADCVVIPSKWEEPFGMVALEAMAMKKAIITTMSGGLMEIVNEESAIIVNKENNLSNNLYGAMIKIYMDKEFKERIELGGYNRVKCIKDFDKENYFENFLEKINYIRR